ncbi:DEAD/DEAH box helicase [Actinomadura rupiterrae]|uniref:DEAD/DEAH box helicase n=1 Tax=Actinomadura rupiterrae TaxID=559627 RepID=UPI0027E28BAB|nr:DEAD/DEAH box helicase [Actinomadura rupiterrae]MCP2340640.1 superfamily II DNA/RNA helicase [Actinomadura rupiterrae]
MTDVSAAHAQSTPAEDVADTARAEAQPGFAELGLPEPLVAALARQGIESPFPIQAAAIPDVMAGHDVLGRGKTGSGKTLAFGLPMLARLEGRRAEPRRPLGLILVPTRELAQQVVTNLEPLGRSLGLHFKTVIGQTSMFKQIDALRRGVEILVATPGRLKDLMRQGAADLSALEMVVLDEADHMADMGFLPDVTDILDEARPGGQRLLFSATLDKDVDVLVQRYLSDPVTHAIGPVDEPVDTMDHHLLLVAPKEKAAITAEIANREGRTILFARTKHGVDRLAKQLTQAGVRAAGLHGGKSQGLRTRTIAEFHEGTFDVLVATDVAARGIHVDNISLVMHVDPPADHKDYMHRAGRTARAGEKGTVVTLVLPHQVRSTSAMTRRAGIEAPKHRVTSGDDALIRLTGAREPSGVPIEGPVIPERPRREAGRGRRGRFNGGGQRRFREDGGRRREFGDREGGSGGYRRDFDGDRRGGGQDARGDRRDRGFDGNRRGGESRGEGFRRNDDRRDSGPRDDRGFRDDRREGGYRGDRPYNNEHRDRNFDGDRRNSNFSGDRREGGSRAPRGDHGFSGDRRGAAPRGASTGGRRNGSGSSYGGPRRESNDRRRARFN